MNKISGCEKLQPKSEPCSNDQVRGRRYTKLLHEIHLLKVLCCSNNYLILANVNRRLCVSTDPVFSEYHFQFTIFSPEIVAFESPEFLMLLVRYWHLIFLQQPALFFKRSRIKTTILLLPLIPCDRH